MNLTQEKAFRRDGSLLIPGYFFLNFYNVFLHGWLEYHVTEYGKISKICNE